MSEKDRQICSCPVVQHTVDEISPFCFPLFTATVRVRPHVSSRDAISALHSHQVLYVLLRERGNSSRLSQDQK
ncbi:uncharacterized [Tachysurus ichikawai]